MKTKIFLLGFCLFLVTGLSFAQKKKQPKSIINDKVAIKKYHSKDELDRKQKGELLVLYIERIESLVQLMPYIAFATKPGITMSTLGIPNDNDNRKILDEQFEATDDFIEKNKVFQQRILPYSDTDDLVSAILFYEDTLKSLHEYSEFH
ncbi:hypothetical protein [Seonamhaeicola aphaedonensis]|uniref:Uncharacterized protein n=1 Tax=Seonamhaeicola aphaedonensis TaxID=1461338 RepID=A0A3D9HIG6_9FLAO|nr:hypothetical protein [Seonamhaeicola aphaedonensis]RED49309.1 hypothetical protein DFQ02_10274 [Seonamhaeicola aphaedonensis]